MKAIITKFHGPTNHLGSRVSANCYRSRIIIGWDYALNTSENHAAAARSLRDKMGWSGDMIGGAMPNSTGYAFVFTRSSITVQGA